MTTFSIGCGPSTGAAETQIVNQYKSLTLGFDVNEAPVCTVALEGNHPAAAFLRDQRDDIWVRRRHTNASSSELLFRGRVVTSGDEWDANQQNVDVGAVGYRDLLNARKTESGDTLLFTGVEQGTILSTLIAATQARSGGALGITNGTGLVTGTTRTRQYEANQYIGALATQLGNVINGFEWEIDPLLKLNVFSPTRGTNRGVKLDRGGTLQTLRRTFRPGNYANVVTVTGAIGTTPVTVTTAGIATDPRGRWEVVLSFPDIIEQTTLTERANAILAERSRVGAGWTATMRTDRWEGTGHLWIGDTASLVTPTTARYPTSPGDVRVIGMNIAYNGTKETVTLTLEAAA